LSPEIRNPTSLEKLILSVEDSAVPVNTTIVYIFIVNDRRPVATKFLILPIKKFLPLKFC